MRRSKLFQLIVPILFLLSAPLVSARLYNTGFSAFNRVIEMISGLFNITVLDNPYVQIGFMRFMLFVLFMAVSFWVFGKLQTRRGTMFDRKTAGVIAAVFSAISAFMMPPNWVTANGSVITGVFAMLIPLGLVIGVVYLCVTKMNKSFIMRLLAILLLFMLLGILDVYHNYLQLPLILLIPSQLFMGKKLGVGKKGDSVSKGANKNLKSRRNGL